MSSLRSMVLPFSLRVAASAGVGVVGSLLPIGWGAVLEASAQEALPGGVFEVLPAADVIGGGGPVELHFVALDANGVGITGIKAKPSVVVGSASELTEVGGGVYRFTYTPSVVPAPTPVPVSVKGKTPAKVAFEATETLTVHPGWPTGIDVVANPFELVLGSGAESTVSFTMKGEPGQPLQGLALRTASTVGTLTNVTAMGGPKLTGRFTAPSVNYPQLAILVAVDARNAGAYGRVVVPLLGKVDYPVKGEPGASIVLRVGERDFGPVVTGADGKGTVAIVVPPGVNMATQTTVKDGRSTVTQIDLKVPETPRLKVFPLPASVPADAAGEVPVRVFVATPGGQADTAANVVLTVEGPGSFGPVSHEGDGVYVAKFRPASSDSKTSVTLRATLGGSEVQVDKVTVELAPRRPTGLTLGSEPNVLPPVGGTVRVFAKVTGSDGSGIAGREMGYLLVGGTVTSAKDLASGDYQAEIKVSDGSGLAVVAVPRQPASGNPVRHLVVVPGGTRVINDGKGEIPLVVMAIDAFGLPVADVDVALALQKGDGKLPTVARTDKNGVAQVNYTSSTQAGMVEIKATAGDVSAGTAFVQAPASVSGPVIPLSGPTSYTTVANSVAAGVRGLQLGAVASGAVAVAVAPPPVSSQVRPAGPVAAVTVTTDPPVVTPGTIVRLKIDAKDANGLGVAGQVPNVAVPSGVPGAIIDLGNGSYEVSYQVPPDFAGGQVTVFVGGVMGTVQVGAGAVAKAPKPPKEPKAPGEPKASGEYPWLRVGVAFVPSFYRYEQRPFTSTGPLLTDVLVIGGDTADAETATPMGFGLGGRMYVPGVPFVGIDARYRSTFYGITTEQFNGEVAPDVVSDVAVLGVGRVPIDLSSSAQIHFGARLGVTAGDFIVFTGDFSRPPIGYETLFVPGLGLGGEVGLEASGLFAVAGVTQSLAYFSAPYAFSIDARVGYGVTDNLFIDAGLVNQTRRMTLVGEDSGTEYGEITDGHLALQFGLGWQM